jgi:hypothetical protein
MKTHYQYRWPTKIKGYGITDPFLKVFVAKYEREISWQVKVRDEETLIRHIQVEMLPSFLARIAYPPNRALKHLYVSNREYKKNKSPFN